jgi:hypothetical protein
MEAGLRAPSAFAPAVVLVRPPDAVHFRQMRESPRTSMDNVGSPGRADTRPIPASYYRTSPATSPTTSPATSRASSMESLDYPLDVQTIESSCFASSRIESVEQPSSTYKSGTNLVRIWYKSGTSLVQVWRSEYKSLLPEATCRRQRLISEAFASLGPVSSQCNAANNKGGSGDYDCLQTLSACRAMQNRICVRSAGPC